MGTCRLSSLKCADMGTAFIAKGAGAPVWQ